MTTTTRNEAAERISDRTLPDDAPPFDTRWEEGWDTAHDKIDQSLGESLAAERRATVERIRAAYSAGIVRPEIAERDRVLAILDEEAAR